jgi:hypothetical protein
MNRPEKVRMAIYGLFSLVLLVTLYFGLRPKGFRFYNQVQWLREQNGISFSNIGMAYSKGTCSDIGITNSISIAVALKPYQIGRRLSKIISIIDENGHDLLAIEQWEDTLMATAWNKAGIRIGKIGLEGDLSIKSPLFAVITINSFEMKLFVSNSYGSYERRKIQLPPGFFSNTKMVVGLGANARNPWRGEMYGLALFNRDLSSQEANSFELSWRKTGSFGAVSNGKPAALFLFDGRAGTTVADQSGHGWILHIPRYPKFFRYEILSTMLYRSGSGQSVFSDVLINFFGFMPFGGCLCLVFLSLPNPIKKPVVFTLLTAFFVSLGIELAQASIPTRSSQLTDVILNAAGACFAAILVKIGSGMTAGSRGFLDKSDK